MDNEFELEWQKSKDKELTQFFWNKFSVSDFSTQFFFPDLSRAYNMARVSMVKLFRYDLKGNKNHFELAGGSNCRGFKLSRVKLQQM